METESLKECSVFFSRRKGSFSSRNRPSRNSTLFSSRRSAWSVLNATKAAKFLLNSQVHFAPYGQENYVFEREFMYVYSFIDVLYIFFFGAKEKLPNALRFEFCNVLSRFYLREWIHDPDSVTRIASKD